MTADVFKLLRQSDAAVSLRRAANDALNDFNETMFFEFGEGRTDAPIDPDACPLRALDEASGEMVDPHGPESAWETREADKRHVIERYLGIRR